MEKRTKRNNGFKKAVAGLIFKGLIVLAGFTSLNIAAGIAPVSSANAAVSSMVRGGVTDSQVITYLNNHGYTGVVIYQIMTDGTRKCTSTNHPNYWTYVYVSQPDQASITGHEDIPF
jgi:hypothetical protein